MGMAASQARLLTLTSRLHDVEYKAQNIMNQKIALATQKDALYDEYNAKLEAKKIQIAFNTGDGGHNFVDATFSTMCTYNDAVLSQYTLTDAKTGKIIVDKKTAEMYESFNTDKYAFAYAMLGMDADFGWPVNNNSSRLTMGMEIGIGTAQEDYAPEDGPGNLFMTDVERVVFNNHKSDEKLKRSYDLLQETVNSSEATPTDKNEALEAFRDTLYSRFGNEIYKYMLLNKQDENNTNPDTGEVNPDFPLDFPKQEFNYYVRLFEQIQASTGCQVVEPQYEGGEEGKTWLNNMVNSGRVLIHVYNKNKWEETSVATSTNQNNLQEAQDDAGLKKAEAEYNHELDIVNRKDTRFDQDLSKLETERSAITKEMESVKTVKKDNIDRTFGIFS